LVPALQPPAGTGWNRLEPAGTGWNRLELAGTENFEKIL
jgi:hypothetical protein